MVLVRVGEISVVIKIVVDFLKLFFFVWILGFV